MLLSPTTETDISQQQLERYISASAFPCLGAKSAVGRRQLYTFTGRDIRSAWDDLSIIAQLHDFADRYRMSKDLFTSFAVIFRQPRKLTESDFETALWERVQSLHDKDVWKGKHWDKAVDPDPTSVDFSLSLGGQAFFVVGLHPNASRAARRFTFPTLVFNLHDQFEQLRADGRYEKLRAAILARDRDAHGSINPMLARHGSVSEARQYSGRAVSESWVCPFKHNRLQKLTHRKATDHANSN